MNSNIQSHNGIRFQLTIPKDDSKNPSPQFNATDLKEKLEHAKKRLEELKEMEKTIKETGDIALTDPDSKMMKVKTMDARYVIMFKSP